MYKLDFYTQYRQFYICDSNRNLKTNSDKFWTDEAFEARLALEDGVLGVGTECYGPIKGELEILKEENINIDYQSFDHVVEGALEVKSGRLQVMDCPNSSIELDISLDPGAYRVRVYSSNLATVDGDEGDDYYRIEVWRGVGVLRKVIKQYVPE